MTTQLDSLANDPQRPTYHFLPPANWMNDPNGVIQWRGQYHLFYQYNPNGAFWGTIHWGHAVSRDLVHWRHLPIALAPTPGGPDAMGCFSGCAVSHDGVPTLIYTGVTGAHYETQVQCLATSEDDDLLTWQKRGQPVIPAPPNGLDVPGFRDPYVWREADSWYAVVGSGIPDSGGTVFLYRSQDLIEWEYLNPLLVSDPVESGKMWECPNFFALGDKHILIISPLPLHEVHYMIGTYANHRFTPEIKGKLDTRGILYAPLTMFDEQGRCLMWAWLNEERSVEAQIAAGWSGVQTIPRLLSLLPDGNLGIQPVPEIQALRRQRYHFADPGVGILSMVRGDALEVIGEFEPNGAQCGLLVRCSPNGEEQTSIYYDPHKSQIVVDRRQSSADLPLDLLEVPFDLSEVESLKLHIFLDRSVMEIFVNGRTTIASRIYPSRADSLGIGVTAEDGAQIKTLDVWEMASIWD